jgi:hypothetical protein
MARKHVHISSAYSSCAVCGELGVYNAETLITTEDRAKLELGARAYNYYDMKPGTIGKLANTGDPDPWFNFDHDDGTHALLNGARICTIDYARRRGFKDA